jgi:enamine deaminase RidA (YjgF/YER057c/UK114 family)
MAMEKKYINPDTLLAPRGYTHIVTIAGPAKLLFISGQVAIDKEGKLVGAGT